MERPTTTIELPVSKAQIELKEWLTGREYEEMQGALYKAMKIKADPNTGIQTSELDATVMSQMHHNGINAYVVSVNGNKEKVLDTILDMHQDDYQFVVKKVEELSKKN